VPNRSKLVRASYTFGGGDAPHERPPRRQLHNAGEVESRARGEDSMEWTGERRERVLAPAVTGSLAWAASFSGAAASTAMKSGAVKENVSSVLHSCRMSTKNASKTQPLAIFSNPPQQAIIFISFCGRSCLHTSGTSAALYPDVKAVWTRLIRGILRDTCYRGKSNFAE
jgi:hypothetical protein